MVESESAFRRLLDAEGDAEGRREVGAGGAVDLEVLQRPTVLSVEAVRMRWLGAWTARESTEPRWP